MDYYSPLRYPGGKGKISKFITQLFTDNLLSDGWYIEPYAGGASVGLSLLFQEYASKIVINDIDKSIYSFWHSILNKTDEFCRLIRDTPVTVENWRYNREIQKNKSEFSYLDLGFSTFYLNRTNRSGIIMAGIIGGVNQAGNWKINARFNKANLIERIERIALYKDRISLYNLDACELVATIAKELPNRTLFYFDPPYYIKGKALYVNHYKHEDHAIVAKTIKSLERFKWVVSYDNQTEIKRLYRGFRHLEYSLNYSATKAKEGSEVMIFSQDLVVPRTSNPTKMNKQYN